MHIAFIHARSRGGADDTLRSVAATLRAEGHRIAGVMPEPCTTPDRHACDMDLIDLASGARLHISQKLGQHSTGCRLDGAAIEAAAMVVANGLAGAKVAPDLMMLNRFGKQEATGHGFHPVIVSALERGVPVLAGADGPPFNACAMDGYAVNTAALDGPGPWSLPRAGDLAAGDAPRALPPGTAIRVLTGAALPQGADAVIMQEEATQVAAGRRRLRVGT